MLSHMGFSVETREITSGTHRVLIVVCGKGDDPVPSVTTAVRAAGIRGAQVTAVGAMRRAELGYFDRARSDYLPIAVEEQVEVLSMLGDIATRDGEPVLHAHVVLGRRDGSTVGGHLMGGQVWPTLEVVVTEVAPELSKNVDPETGLALISP
jgi:predicted DNA-binding protein with PD1-like motif